MNDPLRPVDLTDLSAFFGLSGAIAATLWLFSLAAITVTLSLRVRPEATAFFDSAAARLRELATPERVTPEIAKMLQSIQSARLGLWILRKVTPVAILFQAALLLSLVCLYPRPYTFVIALVPLSSIFVFNFAMARVKRRLAEFNELHGAQGATASEMPLGDRRRLVTITMAPQAIVCIGAFVIYFRPEGGIIAFLVGLEIAVGMLYASDVLADYAAVV
jgi:hypothetical protein